jgi:hypothetical protein
MLLALASAVFLGSESLGTRDHILLSQISALVRSFHPLRSNYPLERSRHRWEDNIKMDLKETGSGSVDWIDLIQDRDQ